MAEESECQIVDMSYKLKDLFHLFAFFLKLFLRSLSWPQRKSLPGYSKERLHVLKEKFSSGPIAHRGGIPENTIESFRSSKKFGINVIEVDLSFSKDKDPVLFHDAMVNRTSNGSGWISDMTLEQIKALDVGTKYNCPGAKIPTLQEAVSSAKGLGLFVILDVKGKVEESVPAICKLFEDDSSLYDCVSVSSFYPNIIYELRCRDPKILCGMACSSIEFSNYPNLRPYFGKSWMKQKFAEVVSYVFHWILLKWAVKVLRLSFMLPIKDDIINGRFNLERFAKDAAVAVWTVNTKDEYDFFQSQYSLQVLTDKVADLCS